VPVKGQAAYKEQVSFVNAPEKVPQVLKKGFLGYNIYVYNRFIDHVIAP
jgi:hypothetical protein